MCVREDVDWTELAQDSDQWGAAVNTVTNVRGFIDQLSD